MQPDPAEAALNMFASSLSNDGAILPVESSDLKKVWKMAEERRERSDPKVHSATSAGSFAAVCSPGANVMAVCYRASMLGMLAQSTGLLAPEVPENVREAVFNVAASFPFQFMKPGVVYEGLPVDVQAFVKQLEDELRRLGFKV